MTRAKEPKSVIEEVLQSSEASDHASGCKLFRHGEKPKTGLVVCDAQRCFEAMHGQRNL